MNSFPRTTRAVGALVLVLVAALTSLAHLRPAGVVRASAVGAPAQQGVQASGFVTNGTGTCFPDAVLLDCSGTVIQQLKGPGGAAFFAPYLGQWVDLSGTELTCVVGDKYVSVTTIEAKPPTCGTPGTSTPTPQATLPPTGIPSATPTSQPLPPGVTPTATPPASGNLALGKAIYASSAPDGARPAMAAVDGDPVTTWASIPDPNTVWDVRHLQWIYVDLGATYPVRDMRMLWASSRNPRVYAIYVWRDAWQAWQWVARTEHGKVDDPVTFPADVEGRYFMLWLEVPALAGSHYELAEWQIGGSASAPIQSTNVAAGRASIALSRETGYDAPNATDANLATEWRSASGLPQWLYVDLTTPYTIDKAILRWTVGMHATSYTLYAWDGATWRAIYATTRGPGGDETVTFAPVRTRYVLVYASAGPASNVGLRELEVYERRSGSGGTLPHPFARGASSSPGAPGATWSHASRSALGPGAAGQRGATTVTGIELIEPGPMREAGAAVPDPSR